MARVWASFWAVTLSLAAPQAVLQQGPLSPRTPPHAAAKMPPADIRVDASLALIPVHVTTADGAFVTDLSKESFHVFEDNFEQQITYFAKDDALVSIGVLLDTSASMQHKMRRCSAAAASVLHTANAEDEFFLIEFNDRPKLTVPFTNDTDQLYRRLVRAGPFGRTSLLDAVHLASVQMKNARNTRKAVLVISDDGDNHSRLSRSGARSDVLESDMQLYAIGIFESGPGKNRPSEELNGPDLLADLANKTGGRQYRVDNLNELGAVADPYQRRYA